MARRPGMLEGDEPEIGDNGSIRQQIGEILGTVRSLALQMREAKDDMRRENERNSREISAMKDEHNRASGNVQLRLEDIGRQVRELDNTVRTTTGIITGVKDGVVDAKEDIGEVKVRVDKLQDLVDQLTNRFGQVWTYFVVAGTIFMAAWVIVGPFLKDLVLRMFGFK